MGFESRPNAGGTNCYFICAKPVKILDYQTFFFSDEKLFLNAEFNTPKHKMYDGGFTISYPARTFSGSFDLAIPGPTYRGNASIAWRSNETVHLTFDSGAIYEPTRHFWIDTRLRTPFAGWDQINQLNVHLYQAKNLLSTNATILWAENQQFILGALTDFEFNEPKIRFEAKLVSVYTVVFEINVVMHNLL